jgi:hypothetical protein
VCFLHDLADCVGGLTAPPAEHKRGSVFSHDVRVPKPDNPTEELLDAVRFVINEQKSLARKRTKRPRATPERSRRIERMTSTTHIAIIFECIPTVQISAESGRQITPPEKP